MRLNISHRTTYTYDHPVPYGLQQMRTTPRSGPTQQVEAWSTKIRGGERQLTFDDHHHNVVSLVSLAPDATTIETVSEGVVETVDRYGVAQTDPGCAPLWLYLRRTALTKAKKRVRAMVTDLFPVGLIGNDVAQFHALSYKIASDVVYVPGTTDATFTVEDVLAAGSGVCQDHAQIFISSARLLGVPARYVSGYLMIDEGHQQAASHAWAEVWIEGLGWIGFDVSNGICPDDRYVRVAVGLDYLDAAPVAGVRFGGGVEALDVSVQVQVQQ